MIRAALLLLALLVAPILPAQDNYDDLIRRGIEQRNAGDFEAAEASFLQAHELARDKREAAFLLGLTLAFQEQYGEAIDVIDRALEAAPNDVNLRLARARIRSYEGEFQESLAMIEDVLVDDPDNIDAANLAARVSLYQKRFVVGRDRYRQVLDREPENLEAIVGLHDSERFLGNDQEAEVALLRAESIAPGHPDVLSRRGKETAAAGPKHEFIAGYEFSNFDRRLAEWYDRFFEYRHLSDNANQQFLRVEHAHRFGVHDSLIEAGMLVRARRSMPLTFAVAVSDESDFLPEWRIRGETGFPVYRGGTDYGAALGRLGFSQARYRSGSVTALTLDVDYYLVSTNAWLTAGIGLVNDEDGDVDFSWRLGYNHQLSSRWRAGFDYASAPDTDAGVTVDTEVLHGYLRYRLFDRTWLRIDAARSDRRGAYVRRSLALTLGHRF